MGIHVVMGSNFVEHNSTIISTYPGITRALPDSYYNTGETETPTNPREMPSDTKSNDSYFFVSKV